mgnify:CR=1 FL=1
MSLIDQLQILIKEKIDHCTDADLLDLVYKLLAAEG